MFIPKTIIGVTRYAVHDKLKFKNAAELRGFDGLEALGKGELVEIAAIKRRNSKGNTLIGIAMLGGKRHNGWHNLDGTLDSNRGYYIEERHVLKNFDLVSNNMIVNKDFPFRKKNLKDMECKLIGPMPNSSESIVEFKENIGGCGADGLGRGGYCLVVPNCILVPVEKQKKKVKKVKKSK